MNTTEYWNERSKTWSEIGGSLKPSNGDVISFKRLLPKGAEVGLVLGATPALLSLPARQIICADTSSGMLALLPTSDNVQQLESDWTQLPLGDESVDWIAGDGILTMMTFPDGYERLFAEMHRILKPEGMVAVRVFLPHAIQHDNIKKFKAALSVMDENHNAVLSDVYNVFPKATEYKDVELTYSFPLIKDINRVATAAGFSMVLESRTGRHPVIGYSKRAASE